MYDPKDILTKSGYENYLYHLKSLENALFEIQNLADDLHIGSSNNDDSMDVIWKLQELIPHLKKGDGEVEE